MNSKDNHIKSPEKVHGQKITGKWQPSKHTSYFVILEKNIHNGEWYEPYDTRSDTVESAKEQLVVLKRLNPTEEYKIAFVEKMQKFKTRFIR